MKVVVLDPGHGGHDSGALGPSGLKEAAMALDVCKRAQALLAPYVKCLLTRDTDVFVTLSARPAFANVNKADAFVSYHFNSGDSQATARSWEIFTTPGQNRSDKLADCVAEAHGKRFTGVQAVRADRSDGDVDKEANFTVIKGTNCPSCLMEGEFIHTAHGEALIKDPANRQKMAEAVAEGVLMFLQIAPSPNEPAEEVHPPTQPLTLEQRVARIEAHLGLAPTIGV